MKITLNIECNNLDEMLYIQEALAQQRSSTPMPHIHNTSAPAQLVIAKDMTTPVKERVNISPGESSITKMGVDMKKAMMAGVGSGAFTDNYTGKSLKYLQLMWKRGEVKFDGKDFYK